MADELEQFYSEMQNSVRAAASADGVFTEQAFVEEASGRLTELEEIDSLLSCHFEGTASGPGKRKLALDGFAFGDEEGQVVLAITDYVAGDVIETMTLTEARRLFSLLQGFAESALDGSLSQALEESSETFQVVAELLARRSLTDKIRLYLITNRKLSDSVRGFDSTTVNGITTEFHLWDIQRFQRVETSQLGREEIDIDLTEWAENGIPVLQAVSEVSGLQTLLAVVPGEMLAGIYRKHGGRVLEANVRSFLSVRANVNRGIRGTIQQEPDMFLAYNNGIAATASAASVVATDGGLRLTSVTDLQIVNGGQTTASLFYVEKNDRSDLSKVFVQMKLIVVAEEQSGALVPKISRYANTQNRVSEADFFSNHPFHVRMEEKSRRILTPAIAGVPYQTKWFYERTRGQYLNEKAKISVAQARRFETEYPRSQMLTKTDAAKFEVSWEQRPHVVSAGAQKNFVAFANQISKQWDTNSDQFGDAYFRQLVARGILFNAIRQLVQKSEWYSTGYLANIVTYSLAKLAAIVQARGTGAALNFDLIWASQAAPSALLAAIAPIAKAVFDTLTDENRPVVNVTEWAKREKCWDQIRSLRINGTESLSEFILSSADAKEAVSDAKKVQRMDSGIEAQTKALALGSKYWVNLRDFGRRMKVLTEKEIGVVSTVTGESGRLPSEAQAKVLMALSARMEVMGFVGK